MPPVLAFLQADSAVILDYRALEYSPYVGSVQVRLKMTVANVNMKVAPEATVGLTITYMNQMMGIKRISSFRMNAYRHSQKPLKAQGILNTYFFFGASRLIRGDLFGAGVIHGSHCKLFVHRRRFVVVRQRHDLIVDL